MLRRSIFYVARNWSRSLLLFLIFLVVAAFCLSGLSVMVASENTSARLRGTTGASFTVERNLDTGGSSDQGNGMSYNTQEYITDRMIKDIAQVDGVEAYNAKYRIYGGLCAADGSPHEMIKTSTKWDAAELNYQNTQYGSFYSEYDSMFLSQKLELTQGRHITGTDTAAVLLSKDLAGTLGLQVGDKTFLYVPDWVTGLDESESQPLEAEIIGLFQINADQPDRDSTVSYDLFENYVFADMASVKKLSAWVPFDLEREGYEYADFYVNDPLQLESMIGSVQKIDGIDWNNFNVTVNDEVYQRSAGSMSNVENLIRTLIILVVAISVGIITLILTMWIKGRTRETGILMAVGISKPAIVLQHILEVAVIAVLAFFAAFAASPALSQILGSVWAADIAVDTISVTAQNYVLVCVFGGILLLAATILSSIPVLRMKPRQILAAMD